MTSKDKVLPKKIGMVHLKGINDESYQKFTDSQLRREIRVMVSIINNRW
jgi:hypothetical protein